ncbi:unnamed protein product [Closterium sp. NIES-53]
MHNDASRANRLRAPASVRTAAIYGCNAGQLLCCSTGTPSTCCVGRSPFCSAGAAPLCNAGRRSTMLCWRVWPCPRLGGADLVVGRAGGAAYLEQWASWSTRLVDLHGGHCKGADLGKAPTSRGLPVEGVDSVTPTWGSRLGWSADKCAGRPGVWSTWCGRPVVVVNLGGRRAQGGAGRRGGCPVDQVT